MSPAPGVGDQGERLSKGQRDVHETPGEAKLTPVPARKPSHFLQPEIQDWGPDGEVPKVPGPSPSCSPGPWGTVRSCFQAPSWPGRSDSASPHSFPGPRETRLAVPGAPFLSLAGAAAAEYSGLGRLPQICVRGPFFLLLALSPLTSMRSSWGIRISGSHALSGVPRILGL